MRVHATVTLPEELLSDLDRHVGRDQDRSEIVEAALRLYLGSPRPEEDAGDLAIINAHAAELNEEAADVLEYQIFT